MSEKTGINWTDHTFNPWSGCAKVSPACTNCYAANLPPSMRRGAEWGVNEPRVPASESYWRSPLTWDRAAAKAGVRRRVFCASVADIFERRTDLDAWRWRLLALVALTPHLDWLLLTKRPDHMAEVLTDPATYGKVLAAAGVWRRTHHELPRLNELGGIPISDPARGWHNLWAGTTVEDQQRADERIPHLLRVPAAVRFLSMEPLLGPVDLTRIRQWSGSKVTNVLNGYWRFADLEEGCDSPTVSWVIVGGESGHRARPTHPDWFRSLRDQCAAAGVPFWMKQWGEMMPMEAGPEPYRHWLYESPEDAPDGRVVLVRPDGSTWRPPTTRKAALAAWEALDIGEDDVLMLDIGKHNSGRTLDGVVHDACPTPRQ